MGTCLGEAACTSRPVLESAALALEMSLWSEGEWSVFSPQVREYEQVPWRQDCGQSGVVRWALGVSVSLCWVREAGRGAWDECHEPPQ